VKAIHTYSSDFYSRATRKGGKDDWASMDETALLAMGILMEEMATEVLGTTGDLVFVEGEPVGSRDGNDTKSDRTKVKWREKSVISAGEAARKSGETRRSKRRKGNANEVF